MTTTVVNKNGTTVFWTLFWTVLSMSYSCQTTKLQPASQISFEDPKGNIVFLSLKMSKDDVGNESVELISTNWSNGVLKEKAYEFVGKEMLLCEFLDRDEKPVSRIFIPHPLFAGSEYFSPDGVAHRNQGGLREASFMVRAQVSSGVVLVSINDTKGKRISLLELN